ncbi:IS200/IS605 family transposase [Vibrio vulnificus]|uniref:IS200/IS605 family transposase n=1 Tax=Vibrio vulnificus TaxID=672 RepID=UPI00102A1201|nr:IS200/IS605 family transposase [Vibrio vulnificus]EGQ7953354.1 IS200/IS605 family transposase [Vibrio vulnificus]EGQ7993237.1 IS200/IS605 family transposase [Vibrio vulnificus]EHZ2656983.1 IS200/IS605 family transposase [Vibrio vulnificus]RZQ18780.1 IS200/IS605 family transposase [Vibrio vulnificus]
MPLKIEGSLPSFENSFHFHAIAKYRSKVFSPEIAKRTETLLLEKSAELGWNILEFAADKDHIHFLIQSDSTPSYIAQRLFGYSSFVLRKEFPELKGLNKSQFWAGEQCNCIVDKSHYDNTVAYIQKHQKV